MFSKSLTFALSMLLSGVAHSAATGMPRMERMAHDVEGAFFRKYAHVNTQGVQPDVNTAELSALFPRWGFQPASSPGTSWEISATSSDEALICLKGVASDLSAWSATISRLARSGYVLADAACQAAERWSAPSAFPANFALTKVLNRKSVPLHSIFPATIDVGGLMFTNPVVPAVRLQREVPHMLTLLNPSQGTTPVSVLSVETLGQVGVAHDCATLAPGQACTLTLSLTTQPSNLPLDRLTVKFSEGEMLIISLRLK